MAARYSEEEKTARQQANIFGGGYSATTGPAIVNPLENFFCSVALYEIEPFDITSNRKENTFSPSASLSWTLSPDASLYTSIGKGHKGGGFNSFAQKADKFEYEGEEATSYEIGDKFDLLEGAAHVNIALFSSDYEDMQQSIFTGATSFIVENATSASIQGLEADFWWMPTDSLTLDGNIGLLDFEFDDYPNAACTVAQVAAGPYGGSGPTCAAQGGNDLSGRSGANSPEITANLGFNYSTMISNYELNSRLEISYSDEIYTDFDLDENLLVDAYTLVNASITLISPEADWDVTLIAKNITNEEYILSGRDVPLITGSYLSTATPLSTIMLNFSHHFGDY